MRLLARILNRMVFIRAEFLPQNECRTTVYLRRGDSLCDADWEQAKKQLCVVVVCGHRVITKPEEAEAAVRVKADAGTFLWSAVNGRLSFVRQEHLQGLYDALTDRRITPIRIVCAESTADFEHTAAEIAASVYSGLRWKSLLKPTSEGSAAAQALARRIALPVLGLFLLTLSANAILSPELNERRQALQTAWDRNEDTTSAKAEANAKQRRFFAEFTAENALPRAVLCDRIARAVPEQVVLTSLEIAPLAKRFEAGKPLQLRTGTAVVCGTASDADDVSEFIRQLSQTDGWRDVRLTSIETLRDTERLCFKIEILL